ncbi:hypothetical protein ACX0LI_004921, partial [Salmonella enterica subsp. enterica serovar Newport]
GEIAIISIRNRALCPNGHPPNREVLKVAIMAELDFVENVIEKFNALHCWGYEVVFGLDGRSLVIAGRDNDIPVLFTSTSPVLLNAAFVSYSAWFKEYSDSWAESAAQDAAAEAASERAITRAYEDSGWLAHAEQDAWEYNRARLDRQSCFYGDF